MKSMLSRPLSLSFVSVSANTSNVLDEIDHEPLIRTLSVVADTRIVAEHEREDNIEGPR